MGITWEGRDVRKFVSVQSAIAEVSNMILEGLMPSYKGIRRHSKAVRCRQPGQGSGRWKDGGGKSSKAGLLLHGSPQLPYGAAMGVTSPHTGR